VKIIKRAKGLFQRRENLNLEGIENRNKAYHLDKVKKTKVMS